MAIPEGHAPKANAWSAVFSESVKEIIFAQFALQSNGNKPAIVSFIKRIRASFELPNGPKHVDYAVHEKDTEGYRNDILLAYWDEEATYNSWISEQSVKEWFHGDVFVGDKVGYYREVVTIPVDRFETLQSSDNQKYGVSNFTPIEYTKVHEYFGSMRDRISISSTKPLESPLDDNPSKPIVRDSFGKRVRVIVPDNLCLIRTAQDLSKSTGEEKQTYSDVVEPVLMQGVDFLIQNPVNSGCLSAKFVHELDSSGKKNDETSVIAFFLSLGHLERWTHSHPTHISIYQSFYELLKKHSFQIDLSLWHEVSVLESKSVDMEYVNCHPYTGLMPFLDAKLSYIHEKVYL
ncbi:phenylacetaldoxime dehydratase [Siminovitchia terrae]|uniref:phenylacetaldoxime dehydratase family protein n=1 Tax=Siminovitchia terrae TaxID=1914933 RepID=UPI001B0FBBBA|nr:phenylacetaldoxime dehydratase family protein [Siminovitchia terrae]GIN90640.1 phenylacetaldoxime dehydratase [Siminovitchia terrae]